MLTFLEYLNDEESAAFTITEMSNLGGQTLYKYDWRTEVFLKKYAAGEEFELLSKKKVNFVPDPEILALVKARKPTTRYSLLTKTGERVPFNQLAKTAEFGGKGDGSGTVKEDAELRSLIDQIDAAKAAEASATLKVKVKNVVHEVYTAASTPGTPKSDFHLVDNDGKEVVWISHKVGKKPVDFQQWGGISAVKEPAIAAHRETKAFIADCLAKWPDGIPNKTSVARKISDKKLKMLSVYGNQYGSKLGRQNVSMLLQGPVKLVKSGSVYTLSANHVHYNGDSMDSGGYDPALFAVYKGDRSDGGLKGARMSIAPIGGRKALEI